MEGLQPSQAIDVEMRRHHAYHLTFEMVFYPIDQLFRGLIIGRCVDDDRLAIVDKD